MILCNRVNDYIIYGLDICRKYLLKTYNRGNFYSNRIILNLKKTKKKWASRTKFASPWKKSSHEREKGRR